MTLGSRASNLTAALYASNVTFGGDASIAGALTLGSSASNLTASLWASNATLGGAVSVAGALTLGTRASNLTATLYSSNNYIGGGVYMGPDQMRGWSGVITNICLTNTANAYTNYEYKWEGMTTSMVVVGTVPAP